MNSLMCKLAVVMSLLLAFGWQAMHGVPSARGVESLRGVMALSEFSVHSRQQAFTAIAQQVGSLVDAWPGGPV